MRRTAAWWVCVQFSTCCVGATCAVRNKLGRNLPAGFGRRLVQDKVHTEPHVRVVVHSNSVLGVSCCAPASDQKAHMAAINAGSFTLCAVRGSSSCLQIRQSATESSCGIRISSNRQGVFNCSYRKCFRTIELNDINNKKNNNHKLTVWLDMCLLLLPERFLVSQRHSRKKIAVCWVSYPSGLTK